MYDSAFTRYAELSYRFLFRYTDRYLHESVIEDLQLRRSDELLEIGCDQGAFLRKLRERCRRGVGVDVNAAAIAAIADPDIRCMSATALDFADESFDKLVSLHTIEHVHDLKRAFREIARVLRPGGRAVIAYPLELVRGFSTLPSAIASHHDPLMARQMHVHKLLPSKLVGVLDGTGLILSHSRLQLWPIPIVPVYVSVILKPPAV
jgi:SAM-dependent methyltransferase